MPGIYKRVTKEIRKHERLARVARKFLRLARKTRRAYARRRVLTLMPKGSICAEIGVWMGDYSKTILRVARPRRFVLVDAWQFMPDYPRAWYGGGIADGQPFMDELHADVLARFAGHSDVEVVRETSIDAAHAFDDAHFDWVYLDANHSYESAVADIRAWIPKIRPGGFLAGDDYVEGRYWFGDAVKRAVDETAASGTASLIWTMGDQFILQVNRP